MGYKKPSRGHFVSHITVTAGCPQRSGRERGRQRAGCGARWFASVRVQVRGGHVERMFPGPVVTAAEKTRKGRLGQVRGVRGHSGAGPRGLTVVVTVVTERNRRPG